MQGDPAARRLLSSYLTEGGYRVQECAAAEEVQQNARTCRPWVIILDVMLPGKADGWQLLAGLKSDGQTKDVPVIIVSGPDETGRGLSMGALDVFVKPVDEEFLPARLNALRRTAVNPTTVLVVDDDPGVVDYLAAVLTSAHYLVSRATSGRQAVQTVLSTPPDVMILDLVMPGLTGFDVLDELSKHPATSKVCVFVLTAKDLTTAEKTRLNSQVAAIARKGELSKEEFLLQLERITGILSRKGNIDENSRC